MLFEILPQIAEEPCVRWADILVESVHTRPRTPSRGGLCLLLLQGRHEALREEGVRAGPINVTAARALGGRPGDSNPCYLEASYPQGQAS